MSGRRINPSLESSGISNISNIFSRPKSVITVGPDNCDYPDPASASKNSKDGDLIIVFPHYYSLGDEYVTLKANVDWLFFGEVKIHSNNSNGTFYDEGAEECYFKIYGDPIVQNSNGTDYQFNLGDDSKLFRPSINSLQFPSIMVIRDHYNYGKLRTFAYDGLYELEYSAGDTVVIFEGEHSIYNPIQLKDNSKWLFYPGVKITSSNSNGVFSDNGAAVSVTFEGNPILENTALNSFDALINLQNSNSEIRNFYLYADLHVEIEGTQYIGVRTNETNIPKSLFDSATLTKISTGVYDLIFGSSSNSGNFNTPLKEYITVNGNGLSISVKMEFYNATRMRFAFYDFSTGDPVDPPMTQTNGLIRLYYRFGYLHLYTIGSI
jgi:hypothetical protein